MTQTGRNAPCPCGSGRKYKKCCLAADEAARSKRASAAPAEAIGHNPEADDSLFSPQSWKHMRQLQPNSAQGKLAPALEQLQGWAEYVAKQPAINAAQEELEAYRDEYERLMQDPRALMDRAEKLIAEPPFEAMRFSVADLDRAFASLGCPPSGGGAEFVAFAGRVVDFLVNDDRRNVLARRMVCLMPDYVAEERYLDAWIIQHCFIFLCVPPEGVRSPFLLCMFLHALRQWQAARDQDEQIIFGQLGLDPAELRRQGPDGMAPALSRLKANEDMVSTVETLLDAHPQLQAQMQARYRDAEQAAVELLEREEGQSLLLDDGEVEPWLQPLSDRIAAHPELVESALTKTKPTEQLTQAFADVMIKLASDMTADIFTSKRLQRLRDDIETLSKQFERDGRDESLALSGLFMAATASNPTAENYVLNRLCLFSILLAAEL